MPRWIPYLALPLGGGLLTFRFLQASWDIVTGKADRLIASHAAEELMEELETVTPQGGTSSPSRDGEG